MDNFASLDTPGDPGGIKVVELSGMKPKSADSVTVNEGIWKLGRCGRQNMLQPYLKIWDSDWIFGRAVTAIFSLGVHSPCLKRSHCRIYWKDFGSTVQKTGFLQRNEMLLPRVLWLTWDLIYRKLGLLLLLSRSLGLRLLKGFLGKAWFNLHLLAYYTETDNYWCLRRFCDCNR